MKRIRIFALTLAILTVISLFTACANGDKDNGTDSTASSPENSTPTDTQPGNDTTDTTPEETTRLYPDLEGINYGGADFTILRYDSAAAHGWSGIPNDISVDAETGEVLADSVYARNLAIHEAIGIHIVVIDLTAGIGKAVQTSIMSGDYLYDLVDQTMASINLLTNGGCLTSFQSISLDLDMPWYDQRSVEAFTVSSKTYAVVSDATYFDKLSTVGVYFNKRMGKNIGIDSLYSVALEGNWTLDKMLSYAKDVSADLNSDGVMDKNDSYCISCQNDAPYFFLHSAGLTTVTNNSGSLSFSANSERALTTFSKINEIITDQSVFFNRQTYKLTTEEVAEMFSNDRALFLIRPLQSLYDLRKFDSQFEIIPLPKFYGEQESYNSPINFYSATAMCVPQCTDERLERAAIVLDALAAESYYTVMPALYDEVLDLKLVSDEQASETLDIIFDNVVYDIGMIMNLGSIKSVVIQKDISNITSALKSIEKAIGKAISSFEADIEKMD